MLTAAAVFVLPGDDDLLQRLKAEEAAALHHIIMHTKTVKKLRKKDRIRDQKGISAGIFQFPDQRVRPGDDGFPGFRLAGIACPALGSRLPQPLIRRERTG